MNLLGKTRRPFLFVIDYEMNECLVELLDEINADEIKYAFNDQFSSSQNFSETKTSATIQVEINALSFEKYKSAFQFVKNNLSIGNSFLCNLTAESEIKFNVDFNEIIKIAKAKYKFWIKDKFVCFSPESFISVNKEGVVNAFPMKGTIDANTPNALEIIKNDHKELYEHVTIVDLLRNDLSKIAEKVWVEKFRYFEKIKTLNSNSLLQVSSQICGQLNPNWKDNIGDWFFELLPAGSISGAPKAKTLEIIKSAENLLHKNGKRGYYSGIFGIFDGEILTSAVMIRCIEKTNEGFVFKSGGGITHNSVLEKEYEELIQKIYVPVF